MVEEINIKTLPIKDAYNLFVSEMDEEDDDDTKKTYMKARFGIDIPFDIYDYLNGTMIIKPKRGVAVIKGKGYKLAEIYTEIEKRNQIIKRWLVEKIGDLQLTTPR